jgi:nickel-dependent lactate racemase
MVNDLPGEIKVIGCLNAASPKRFSDEDEIRTALSNLIFPSSRKVSIRDLIQADDTICIIVSDQTRETGARQVLPVLMDCLFKAGCKEKNISFLFACGIHRQPDLTEQNKILGEAIFQAFKEKIFCHNADDERMMVKIGRTSRGNIVEINKLAAEAKKLILVGAASFHYHAGFGGGRKSIVPGIASRHTIANNHSLTLDKDEDRIHPCVEIGRLAGNPVAEEMLESALLTPPAFIINTVLSPEGKIIGIKAGDMQSAHLAACKLVEQYESVNIKEKADLVIASALNAQNFVQAHKALFNASRAVKETGIIILEAPCPEGIGNERFKHWLSIKDVSELYRQLRMQPEVNGQTALSTKMRAKNTILITMLSNEETKELLQTGKADDMKSAINDALVLLKKQGITQPACYIMPHAMHIVPFVKK